MPDSTVILTLTKRHADALVAALSALGAIATEARLIAYGTDAEAGRVGGIVSERAAVASNALVALLIALEVHGESRRARRALDRLHAVDES